MNDARRLVRVRVSLGRPAFRPAWRVRRILDRRLRALVGWDRLRLRIPRRLVSGCAHRRPGLALHLAADVFDRFADLALALSKAFLHLARGAVAGALVGESRVAGTGPD